MAKIERRILASNDQPLTDTDGRNKKQETNSRPRVRAASLIKARYPILPGRLSLASPPSSSPSEHIFPTDMQQQPSDLSRSVNHIPKVDIPSQGVCGIRAYRKKHDTCNLVPCLTRHWHAAR